MKQTLLICGDSFAADWQTKFPTSFGWPNLLSNQFDVTNLAQAGCSQYKILKQLRSVNLAKFDKIIISHTSPYRLYVENHPFHHSDELHHSSDFIYADVKEQATIDHRLAPLVEYFEKYYDLTYAEEIFVLLCKEIFDITKAYDVLHLVHTFNSQFIKFDHQIQCDDVFKQYPGLMNHYSDEGNKIIYDKIISNLKHFGYLYS